MSDYRAIQGVTSSIKNVLERFMFLNRAEASAAERVEVSVGLPDQEPEEPGRRVNLLLYHVTECPHLKNQDTLGAAHPGEYGRPPLTLDLHYLVTAYTPSDGGDQSEAHQILGDAMSALHDHALLQADVLDPALGSAVERPKITLEPLTVEDLTKVWLALNTPYRLSVGYKVTVVRIDSRRERGYPARVGEPPGGGPRVAAVPVVRPLIGEVFVVRQGDATKRERVPHARVGDTLVLKGQNLAGTRVLLDGVDATAGVTLARAERLEVTVPDDVSLQPGAVTVRVAADVPLGDPPVPHRGVSSNLSAFVLVPRPVLLAPNLGANPRTLRITGSRLFAAGRECLTLVGDRVVPSADYTTREDGQIVMPLPAGLGAGAYPVRVRVNGAESVDAPALVIP